MKVTIQIDCNTINELKLHLTEIRRQINVHEKKGLLSGDLAKEVIFNDGNCYGEHTVKIKGL